MSSLLVAELFLALLAAGLVVSSTNTRAPNLHLLLAVVLTHAAGDLAFLSKTSLDEAMLWLDVLEGIEVIIDESKASSAATTEFGVETEDNNEIFVSLELGCDLLLDFIAGRGLATNMHHINNKLLAVEELVDDVLADTQGDLRHSKGRPNRHRRTKPWMIIVNLSQILNTLQIRHSNFENKRSIFATIIHHVENPANHFSLISCKHKTILKKIHIQTKYKQFILAFAGN